jgi:hypothetical protein
MRVVRESKIILDQIPCETSDYRLWMCRLEAVLEDQDIAHVLQSRSDIASSTTLDAQLGVACKKAAAITIHGLADKPLGVVVSHRKNPSKMIGKLNERYASSSFSTRMSLMSELNDMAYTRNADMSEYVDNYTSLLDRLETMCAKVPQPRDVIMFLSSMRGQFEATVAALLTMGNDELSWNDDTSRLIEEASSAVSRIRRDTALATVQALVVCDFCGRPGHEEDRCWTNPSNPKNRLGSQQFREAGKGKNKRAASAQVDVSSSPPAIPIHILPAKIEASILPPVGANESPESASQNSCRVTAKEYHLLYVRAPPAALYADPSAPASQILVDSVASKHMCPHRNWFSEIRDCAPIDIVLVRVLVGTFRARTVSKVVHDCRPEKDL